jgi:hypothetical protein
MPRKKTRKRAPQQRGQTVSVLKEIRDAVQSSQTSFQPDTIDVPFPRVRQSKPISFIQSYSLTLSTSATVENDFAITPTIGNLPDATSWAAVFDAYRIMHVKVKFSPPTYGGLVSAANAPIVTAIDYDDATTVNASGLEQYDTAQESPLGTVFYRCFIPRVASALYNGATFSGFGQAKAGFWVDFANTGVPHYGLKVSMPVTTVVVAYFAVVTLFVQCKNTR